MQPKVPGTRSRLRKLLLTLVVVSAVAEGLSLIGGTTRHWAAELAILGALALLALGLRTGQETAAHAGRKLAALAWRARLPAGPPQAVVLVAYYFPPHNTIGAARPHRFARYLRRRGADVAVVCSSEMLSRVSDMLNLEEAAAQAPSPERVPGPAATPTARRISTLLNHIQRMLLPYDDRISWLPHAYVAAARAMTAESVLVSTHPPVVAHLAALVIKMRCGRPWVADFRDPLWGNPSRTARRASWIDPVIEGLIVGAADAVIANTDAAAAVLRLRYPSFAAKVHVIWNGIDPEDAIVPLPKAATGRCTVSHVGTLYGARTPMPFLQSLQRLAAAGTLPPSSMQFRQIGHCDPGSFDPDHPALAALSSAGCLFRSSRHMPQADARQEMLQADVLLLLDINDTNPGLQVPAKTFEYVQTGRPILALTVPGSPTARVLAIAGVPHLCMDLNTAPEAFDAQVLAFLSTRHEPARASTQFEREFGADAQVGALVSILAAVSSPARRRQVREATASTPGASNGHDAPPFEDARPAGTARPGRRWAAG